MKAPSERLKSALDDSSQSLRHLAVQLRDEGMAQQELYGLFDRFRAIHQNDSDEAKYEAILDSMDLISGWCSPSECLFPGQSLPVDEGPPDG